VVLALLAGVLAWPGLPAWAASSPATATVGVAPALPAAGVVGGDLPGGTPLQVTVALQPSDAAGLGALVAAVSTPGSPEFRQYLTPAQFAARFGATPATVAAVQQALAAQGLTTGTLSPNRLSITYSTTAAAASAAFATRLREVTLAGGKTVFANASAPLVPAAVAPAITAIAGLDDLPAAAPDYAVPTGRGTPAASPPAASQPAGSQPAASPPAGSSPAAAGAAVGPSACTAASTGADNFTSYLPSQLASAYGITGLYNDGSLGAGQTVALFELTTYASSDIAAYQSCFGTSTSVTNITVSPGPADASGDVEAELDIEGVIGLAPQAAIDVYEGSNDTQGILNTFAKIASDGTAKVVSTSWTSCEPSVGSSAAQAESTSFAQMAAQGQTVFAASGDRGAEACYGTVGQVQDALAVNDPASQPGVTGVGGTSLTNPSTPPAESVWNNSTGAGGGGLSTLWTQPGYQVGPGVTNTFSSGRNEREVPDVSASSDPNHGYTIYYTGSMTPSTGWQGIGGTSAAAPLWASIVALANTTCRSDLGFLNPGLYQDGLSSGSFNDVTSGNNAFVGSNPGDYPATSGYDLASGLGTPIATGGSAGGLVQDWCAAPSFTADSPPSPASAGTPYSYTFTASGFPAPAFSLASGSLPPGLSLASSGVLSGTPDLGGSYTFKVQATGSQSPAVTPNLTIVVDQAPAFVNESPPATAATSVPYSYTFTASGYPAPTFSVTSGSLPTPLKLASSGVLSGTPNATGSFTFAVSAANGIGSPAQTPSLTIVVSAPQAPQLVNASPPGTASLGASYSYTFTASGSPQPTFSVTSGSLPPGLTLDAGSGVLSGTPSVAGSYRFVVVASNGVNPPAQTATLSITVTQAPAFTADAPPGGAALGSPYSYTFTASGTPAPTFAVASGSLPPGLGLGAANGTLSGTPTATGAYTFTVSASNGIGSPATTPALKITVGQAPAFTAASPPPGRVAQSYAYVFQASGTPAPTFAVASGSLPPGLGLDPANGLLFGVPSAAGSFAFTVSASNGVGAPAVTPAITVTIALPVRTGKGYWEVASDGGLFSYGNATFYGSTGGMPINKPIVGMAATPDDGGYWEVASDGGLFSYGDATFYGSMGGKPLNRPIVGMVATPDGRGYWEVASDGGLFSYGNATFYGSTGGMPLNKPIVGMVATPDGKGYWEVASDGGLFSYGNATFYGSTGGMPLNKPIVGMVATPDGRGYWEVASDGGLFSFGDATFYGSTGGKPLNKPIVGMVGTPDGQGYWEVASDGGLFSYGDATFYGSAGGLTLNKPIVGMAGS
jgi:hypothetical protein